MAVNGGRPWLSGLRPVPGSARLVCMRWCLIVIAGLPALAAGLGGVGSTAARQPYFVDVTGRFPMTHMIRFFAGLPASVWAGVAIALALGVVGQLWLTAGALEWLAPGRNVTGRGRVLATVWREGRAWFWTMLRVALVAAVIGGVGAALISSIFSRLIDHGRVAGWSGRTLLWQLPLWRGLLIVVWFALVGAWAFWCRLLAVADGRRTVRSVALLVLRVWWRRPLRAPLGYALATLATVVLTGVVVVAWRQSPPASVAGARAWMLLWCLALLTQAAVWHWLLRAGRLLYAGPEFGDLRARPDGPWGVRSWLRRRRRTATPTPPRAIPPDAAPGPTRPGDRADDDRS